MRLEEISIIIPAFNEAKALAEFLPALKKAVPDAEIIIVNDGSTDDTAQVVEKNQVKLVRHLRNRGYGASLRTGIRAGTRPFVLVCDADGQHTTSDILKVIEAWEDDVAMVVGARTENSHKQKRRMMGKWILHHFANFLAGEKIPDFNSGLRLVKRDILLKYFHLMPDGFSMSTTMTFAFLKGNHNIKWVPITTAPRIGKSSVKQIKHGSQVLLLMLRLTVLFEPLKVFLWLAGILFVMTLINVSINLYLTKWMSIGTTTVLLFISSLIVFMIGLVCDQVSALRREIHD